MGDAITTTSSADRGRGVTAPVPELSWLERRHLPATVAAYILIFAVALLAAFGLAYNFHRSAHWFWSLYLPMLAMAVPIKLAAFGRMRQFRGSWRYVGMYDLLNIAWASWVGSFLFFLAFFVIENFWTNRFGTFLIDRDDSGTRLRQSVFLLDWAATIALVSACRVGARLYVEEVRAGALEKQSRVLILGAGDTGETVLREILRMPGQPYKVVGLLDDRTAQRGRTIHGVEVLGTPDDIALIREKHVIDELLIALPSPTPRDIRRVVEICEGSNLRFRLVPGVADLIDGRMHVSGIREVDIEDLLGREPVALDTDALAGALSRKRILVTGAGGSIGAEICRQVARFGPDRLILVEQAENNLFEIERELRFEFPRLHVVACVADICDRPRLRSIIAGERPVVLFHAAAHKHVPMMEFNPGEAVKNNIGGTRIIADLAAEAGVAKTVMISTDKAVNPTSVMGCTKRIAEMYVQQLSARGGGSFITVRFGNVLGSSGSVVPIFREQIARGGPVTVTHPEMVRYFMTIAEAAQLVLQAGVMGTGGEIYVLDMGEPVKIVDLARDMITLSGLRPGEDIEIVFTGLRPGEKLFEELSMEGEDVSRTTHPKIGIWRHRPEDFDRIVHGIDRLLSLSNDGDAASIRHELRNMVPEYQPNGLGE
ncbi:MAG: polysaccharide biosynthesis protein [Phycisphaerales bacterium]|nr:polysaccharide biosynthesis protein [Phycisphaerales bacterium]